jgi:hypothetical protein
LGCIASTVGLMPGPSALPRTHARLGRAYLENHILCRHLGLENRPKFGQEPRADDAVEENRVAPLRVGQRRVGHGTNDDRVLVMGVFTRRIHAMGDEIVEAIGLKVYAVRATGGECPAQRRLATGGRTGHDHHGSHERTPWVNQGREK